MKELADDCTLVDFVGIWFFPVHSTSFLLLMIYLTKFPEVTASLKWALGATCLTPFLFIFLYKGQKGPCYSQMETSNIQVYMINKDK